jgi:hypothetical protein
VESRAPGKTEGFLKGGATGRSVAPGSLTREQKALLNRKGNELFNKGEVEAAKRVFLTTGYSDGLSRVGDSYVKQHRQVEALQMYWKAHDEAKAEALIEKIASFIRYFLQEDAENDERPSSGQPQG